MTMRIENLPVGPQRIPRFASCSANVRGRPAGALTSKITMLVTTFFGSSEMPLILRKPVGQMTRVFVIAVQQLGRFFERHQPRSRQHARLAHPAAQQLAADARLVDKLARADQHRAHRRAQRLRQAEHHRIEFARDFRDASAQRRGRVENARAVQMHRNARRVRAIANILGNLGRIDGAAVHVVRVFQFDQAGLRAVINLRANQRLDQVPA